MMKKMKSVLLNKVLPIFKQDPFLSFRELRNKDDIQFGDNGTTISAVSNKAYVFERDKSVGDPKIDLLRTLNIPALVSRHFKFHYCGFYPFLSSFLPFFLSFLLSDITRCSRLVFSLPSPRISNFSKEAWFLSLNNGVRNKIMIVGTRASDNMRRYMCVY